MLHFDRSEYDERIKRVRKELRLRQLDALLIFAQESHYYLTGFDSGGYKHFQCSVLSAEDAPITLLTRRPDLQQARRTSTISDIRLWFDSETANPARDLQSILKERGLQGGRIGVEMATFGLTAFNWERLRTTLEGWCTLVDASDVVQRLRAVKSEAELVYVRKSAEIADAAVRVLNETARPGVDEADVIAAIDRSTLALGGDVGSGPRILGSGPKALLVRAPSGTRRLAKDEQITMEWAGIYRRYHTGIFRTAVLGRTRPEHARLFNLVKDALSAMTEAATPGQPLGHIDEVHRRIFDAAGYEHARQWTAGYSLGATFPPRGLMDYPPLLYAGNPTLAQPGMVFFLHAVISDERTETAMTLGHTVLITANGREVLSKEPLRYVELV